MLKKTRIQLYHVILENILVSNIFRRSNATEGRKMWPPKEIIGRHFFCCSRTASNRRSTFLCRIFYRLELQLMGNWNYRCGWLPDVARVLQPPKDSPFYDRPLGIFNTVLWNHIFCFISKMAEPGLAEDYLLRSSFRSSFCGVPPNNLFSWLHPTPATLLSLVQYNEKHSGVIMTVNFPILQQGSSVYQWPTIFTP